MYTAERCERPEALDLELDVLFMVIASSTPTMSNFRSNTLKDFVVGMMSLKAWRSDGLPLSNEVCSPLPLK